jgi:hypothetical protein
LNLQIVENIVSMIRDYRFEEEETFTVENIQCTVSDNEIIFKEIKEGNNANRN